MKPWPVDARRQLLRAGVATGAWLCMGSARSTTQDMQAAMAAFTGQKPARMGRITLDIAPLVDNGNSVPVTVLVDSPMTSDDYVTDLALFNQRNPKPEVMHFKFTPRSGRAWVSTRIRLATTQDVVAVARMVDGSYWMQAINVNVSIAACLEETT